MESLPGETIMPQIRSVVLEFNTYRCPVTHDVYALLSSDINTTKDLCKMFDWEPNKMHKLSISLTGTVTSPEQTLRARLFSEHFKEKLTDYYAKAPGSDICIKCYPDGSTVEFQETKAECEVWKQLGKLSCPSG